MNNTIGTIKNKVLREFFDGRTSRVVLPDDLVRHTISFLMDQGLVKISEGDMERMGSQSTSTRTVTNPDADVSATYMRFCGDRDDLVAWAKLGELDDVRLSREDDLEIVGFGLSPSRHGLLLQIPETPEAIAPISAVKYIYSHATDETLWMFFYGNAESEVGIRAITPKDLVTINDAD